MSEQQEQRPETDPIRQIEQRLHDEYQNDLRAVKRAYELATEAVEKAYEEKQRSLEILKPPGAYAPPPEADPTAYDPETTLDGEIDPDELVPEEVEVRPPPPGTDKAKETGPVMNYVKAYGMSPFTLTMLTKAINKQGGAQFEKSRVKLALDRLTRAGQVERVKRQTENEKSQTWYQDARSNVTIDDAVEAKVTEIARGRPRRGKQEPTRKKQRR